MFTHITDNWPEWLLEMHRVLGHGGRLVLTYLGEGIVPSITGDPWEADKYCANFAMIGNPWTDGGPAVFHLPWWLRAHWGRLFQIDEMLDFKGTEAATEHGVIMLRKDDRQVPHREKTF